jgi:2,3-bisphosphoglycerate-dependent phosphoglycerate mutase
VLAEYGGPQFMAWRRSYDHAPPPIPQDDEYSQFSDARYETIPADARPLTESLKDVTARLLPYWYDAIVPDLRNSGQVLVVSHGNTLRALIKHLDRLTDEQVAELDVPTGRPLHYRLGQEMTPVVRGGSYIDG